MEKYDKLIELFEEYREHFGLTNKEFPEMEPQDKQCEFEDKFCELICEIKGHDIISDTCGIPEHDYCFMCNTLKSVIERSDG